MSVDDLLAKYKDLAASLGITLPSEPREHEAAIWTARAAYGARDEYDAMPSIHLWCATDALYDAVHGLVFDGGAVVLPTDRDEHAAARRVVAANLNRAAAAYHMTCTPVAAQVAS